MTNHCTMALRFGTTKKVFNSKYTQTKIKKKQKKKK